MQLVVSIQTPDKKRIDLKLEADGPLIIGRDQECHIVLPSASVSRRHARVEVIEDAFVVTDISSNGTIVGTTHLTKDESATLSLGSQIRIGPYRIEVRKDVPVGPPTKPVLTQPPTREVGQKKAKVAAERIRRASSPPAALPGNQDEIETSDVSASRLERTSQTYETVEISNNIRKRVHRLLIDFLDLSHLDSNQIQDASMRGRVLEALDRILEQLSHELPPTLDKRAFKNEMADEALGLGPLERLLADDAVTEIMVVDPYRVYVEKAGRIELTNLKFSDDNAARAVIERIVTPLGRRIDESHPLVERAP